MKRINFLLQVLYNSKFIFTFVPIRIELRLSPATDKAGFHVDSVQSLGRGFFEGSFHNDTNGGGAGTFAKNPLVRGRGLSNFPPFYRQYNLIPYSHAVH